MPPLSFLDPVEGIDMNSLTKLGAGSEGYDISPSDNMDVGISALIPLAIALIAGGKDHLAAGASGGLAAGLYAQQNARASSRAEARKQELLSAATEKREAKQLDIENRAELQRERLAAQAEQGQLNRDLRSTIAEQNNQTRAMLASVAAAARSKKDDDEADPVLVDTLKTTIENQNKYGSEVLGSAFSPLPIPTPGMSIKDITQLTKIADASRVNLQTQANQQQRKSESSIPGLVYTANPTNSPTGSFPQKEVVDTVNKALRGVRPLLSSIDQAEDVFDVKKTGVPQSAMTEADVRPGWLSGGQTEKETNRKLDVIRKRQQSVAQILVQLKSEGFANFGAAFTENEQAILQNIIGAISPDMNASSVWAIATKSGIQGVDFQRALGGLRDHVVDVTAGKLGTGFVIDEDYWKNNVPGGVSFINSLRKSEKGRSFLDESGRILRSTRVGAKADDGTFTYKGQVFKRATP